MQITYQKKDGSVMQRFRNTTLPYKIGDETSMGWKVLNIEYEYNNKYYPEYQYNIIKQKRKRAYFKKKKAIEICKNEFKMFIYCFITIVFIYLFKMLLGI